LVWTEFKGNSKYYDLKNLIARNNMGVGDSVCACEGWGRVNGGACVLLHFNFTLITEISDFISFIWWILT
jgi:hypothetical protein